LLLLLAMNNPAQHGSLGTVAHLALSLLLLAGCADDASSSTPNFALGDGGSSLDLRTARPLYVESCTDSFVWEVKDDAGWRTVMDAPTAMSELTGYYLDDVFVPPPSNEGCDVIGCQPLLAGRLLPTPQELVVTGYRAPPAGTASAVTVPTIETRPAATPRRLVVTYFDDENCRTQHRETITP